MALTWMLSWGKYVMEKATTNYANDIAIFDIDASVKFTAK